VGGLEMARDCGRATGQSSAGTHLEPGEADQGAQQEA